MRDWLASTPNLHPVGRNGMHRYNNQDHSMYTAMLTVQHLIDGASHERVGGECGGELPGGVAPADVDE